MSATPGATSEPVPTEPPVWRHPPRAHLRAALVLLGLLVLLVGMAYPAAVTGFAQLVEPTSANGGLLYWNGTLIGATNVAQNLTNASHPGLFWERPSLIDYQSVFGFANPPGPTDPALGALLNETIAYLNSFGNGSANASYPLSFVSPSASGFDPDVPVAGALIQVPRVAHYSGLGIATLQSLVNRETTYPVAMVIGEPYVNVLDLDLALLHLAPQVLGS